MIKVILGKSLNKAVCILGLWKTVNPLEIYEKNLLSV